MRWSRALLVTVLAVMPAACGQKAEPATPFTLVSSPQFVNRLIPGDRPLALVTTQEAEGSRVELTASASLEGAEVRLLPEVILPGETAEVWVVLPEVTEEVPFTITVAGTSGGDGGTRDSIEITATAVPGTDDLAATATDIVALFIGELAGTVGGLPGSTEDLGTGTPVAGLLVVSHYAWFTDDYEIGLAWHVMIAPDDWAELYLRPRGEQAPTVAFRLDSWSTALAGGEFAITEIEAPPEVTR